MYARGQSNRTLACNALCLIGVRNGMVRLFITGK
jgi:hypothetical protein